MIPPHEYPDHTTPWKSHAEQFEAMSDPRYQRDEYFRRACESKCGLGFLLNDGPQVADHSTVTRVTLNQGDFENDREKARLTKERDALLGDLATAERRAVIESAKNPDAERIVPRPFASRKELMAAMSVPEYSTSPNYVAHVEERVRLTDMGAPGFDIEVGHTPNS